MSRQIQNRLRERQTPVFSAIFRFSYVLAAQAHPTRLHVIKLNIHDLFLNKYRKYLRSTYPKVDNT